jgi:hypothetical protein
MSLVFVIFYQKCWDWATSASLTELLATFVMSNDVQHETPVVTLESFPESQMTLHIAAAEEEIIVSFFPY